MAVEGRKRVSLSTEERAAIREAVSKECPRYRLETKAGDVSEWVYPKHRLDFEEFGPPCLALADDAVRAAAAGDIADEVLSMRQALATSLPSVLAAAPAANPP